MNSSIKKETYFENKIMCKLWQLHIGEKFYMFDHVFGSNGEERIFEMLTCDYDMNDPSWIYVEIKPMGDYPIQKIKMSGSNVRDNLYYRYSRRDRRSFAAGFRFALKLCKQHMGTFDIQNAGIENDINEFLVMNEHYQKWKKNG
jgi:hypothetical protein